MDNRTIGHLAAFIDELNETMRMVEGTDTSYFFNKLHEETGEVAEVGSAMMGSESKQKKLTKKCGTVEAALLEELADTFVVTMVLARRANFTTEDILREAKRKMQIKNEKRRRARV